jgi:CBS domain-containing protein
MTPTSITVRSYMARQLVTFSPDTEIMEAMHTLLENRITAAPVIDSRGRLVGFVSEHDFIRAALSASYHGELGGRIESIMTTDIQTVDPDQSILEVAERMVDTRFKRFVVMERNRVVGQISRRDVLRALDRMYRTHADR